MAAQVMANELDLELYRINLSAVVSKYVGETEKNLNMIFEEASKSLCILFFDEADAPVWKTDGGKRLSGQVSRIWRRHFSCRRWRITTESAFLPQATSRILMRHSSGESSTWWNFPFRMQGSGENVNRVFPEACPVREDVNPAVWQTSSS